MKYFLMLFFLFIVACSQSNVELQEEDFLVTVKTDETTLKANTDFELITGITNLSETSVEVFHQAPLIHVQIYDEDNKSLINMFLTDNMGVSHKLKPKEFYNPDSKMNGHKNKVISIEKPGKYTLIGTASFETELNGEPKEYEISSKPYEIIVE